ncbi:phage tail length tape measure family protein [Sphingomonas endolithica]|uniref:phage tail length tape measure family protein n=1 Tax=Sphingomonas endolithica TaxID=2972485 RepID=UPI0021AF97E3|nr:phage tail length tape measure family protein [Sphingomonas sp. ZFBP2030]
MDEGSPTLEVGFAIDSGGSFDELLRLQSMSDSTEAKLVRDFANIERASGGMVKTAPAVASIQAFANAATRAEQDVRREKALTERSIEGLIKQMDRETAAVGRTRQEQRAAKAEELAIAAARQGNTDAADRLLASTRQLSAAQDALAQDKLAAETRAAAEALRERERAEVALISQLRERSRLDEALSRTNGTDRPRATDAGATYSALAAKAADDETRANNAAAASAQRLAREHAELVAMVRGSQAAMEADAAAAERLRMSTDPLYAATKRLNDEIAESTRLYRTGATAPAEYARQQEVLTGRLAAAGKQHDALAGSSRRSGFAMQQFALQLPDIIQGLLTGQKPMTIAIQQGGQLAQVAQMAEGGMKGFARQLLAGAAAFAPFIAVAAVAVAGFALFDRAVSKGIDTKEMVAGLGLTRAEIKRLKDTTVDTGDVVKATFQVMAKRVGFELGNVKGWFGDAMDFMTKLGRLTLAGIYAEFVGTFRAVGAIVKAGFAGKGIDGMLAAAGGAYKGAFDEANGAMKRFGADVSKQIGSNKLKELQKQAKEIKLDRPDTKDKPDRHAEMLARNAEAVEAQIKNLYALAEAYDISGAAALIAEARVKAETQAIKQRADIEAAVDRQIRLSIAERVSNASKGSAAMRDQAAVQAEVNGMVAAGTVTSERAAELVQQRIAELPLLAAIEVAQQRGLKAEAEAATKALEGQRDAQARIDAAAIGQRFTASDAAADRRLAELREELRLVGATEMERVRGLATIRAQNQALAMGFTAGTPFFDETVRKLIQIEIATKEVADANRELSEQLSNTANIFDAIDQQAQTAARSMADAFGGVGSAIGDTLTIMTGYYADQARLQAIHDEALRNAQGSQRRIDRENALYAARTSGQQVALYANIAGAAKGLFKEHSAGYRAMAAAEKALAAMQLALALKSVAVQIGLIGTHVAAKVTGDALMATSDTARAGVEQSNSLATTAVKAVEAVINAIRSLPFPANLAAGAATAAAIVAMGVGLTGGFGGGKNNLPKANDGTGTVLGDRDAKSESIKNAIDALADVDTLTNTYARNMAASLRSIDSQIGGVAALVVRAGNVDASAGVKEGFKPNAIGSVLSKIPLIGGILGGLFGSKTKVIGSGLYGGAQTVGSIVNNGFDASYYSDVEKKKKFLGLTTSTKYSTNYTGADAGLESQFTLILREFNSAIAAAAGPLGVATGEVQSRLNSFVVNIGKIDLQGLTGAEIEEKLNAVFGAAADGMANAAFPGLDRLQKVGEGAFETLVRVASTVEAVTNALDALGGGARALGIEAKVGLADQFDSIGDFTSATEGYFEAFYTQQEQAAAKTAQLTRVFGSLNLTMPTSLAGYRQLVDAQDLNTAAGREVYATLLKLAPAFADLQSSMDGARSAADILSERQDLERRLLELRGDTAAIRALDLAKLDASNRALQEQIYAVQDAQDAAKAAADLASAWSSVGDSITAEINRIRGLSGTDTGGGFATLLGRFNAANTAARGGDMDAAKNLPGLSQALLTAAAQAATSRQELDRIQGQTAASLEATNAAIAKLSGAGAPTAASTAAMLSAAATASQATAAPKAANDDLADEIRGLREDNETMRRDLTAALVTIASNTGRTARKLDDVTAASGGDAISTANAA